MTVRIYDQGTTVEHNSFVFPGGEVQVSVYVRPRSNHSLKIYASLCSSDDIMELLLVTDSIRRQVPKKSEIHLIMPYVPYARQDRVMNRGEALSIKVFCDLINSQNYDSVTIEDPHSDVTPFGLNNCIVLSQADVMVKHFPLIQYREGKNGPKSSDEARKELEEFTGGTVLVAPDAGALKKIRVVGQAMGINEIVCAEKARDTKTGAITGTVVHSEHIGDKDFLIVDDICDGGKTFTELAKALRPLTNGKIILYVTHGIFSKGVDVFKGLIDEVYCANSFGRFPGGVDVLNHTPF